MSNLFVVLVLVRAVWWWWFQGDIFLEPHVFAAEVINDHDPLHPQAGAANRMHQAPPRALVLRDAGAASGTGSARPSRGAAASTVAPVGAAALFEGSAAHLQGSQGGFRRRAQPGGAKKRRASSRLPGEDDDCLPEQSLVKACKLEPQDTEEDPNLKDEQVIFLSLRREIAADIKSTSANLEDKFYKRNSKKFSEFEKKGCDSKDLPFQREDLEQQVVDCIKDVVGLERGKAYYMAAYFVRHHQHHHHEQQQQQQH